jgi:hypothetical protein
MKFYNVDLQGKFWVQRGASEPAGTTIADRGRLFFPTSKDYLSVRNSTGWTQVWDKDHMDELAAALVIDTTGIDSVFLRKDEADSTLFNVEFGGLTRGGNTVWDAGNDGAASGLDADLLDGQHGTYYLAAANLTGTVASARLTGTYAISISGTADIAKYS